VACHNSTVLGKSGTGAYEQYNPQIELFHASKIQKTENPMTKLFR